MSRNRSLRTALVGSTALVAATMLAAPPTILVVSLGAARRALAACDKNAPTMDGDSIVCDANGTDTTGVQRGVGDFENVTVTVQSGAEIAVPGAANGINNTGSTNWIVENFGSISSEDAAGIGFFGGTITNHAGATVSGVSGIGFLGATAIVNAGTITATASVQAIFGGNLELTLQGTSVLNGDVLLQSGTNTLNLEGNNSEDSNFTGIQTVNVADGANWTLSGDLTPTTGAGTAFNTADNSALTTSGVIGGGPLSKTGAGTLTLAGANTYTGGTTIGGGTLSVSSDGNLGDASGGLTFDGGTLQNTAAFPTARDVTLDDRGGTFQTDVDLNLNGIIDGSGGLTKSGSAFLILGNENNSYTGGTTVNAGTLRAWVTGALGSGPVTVNQGAYLSFDNYTDAQTSLLQTTAAP